MINRQQMKIGEQVERQVDVGVSYIAEGMILCEIIQNGIAVVTVVGSPSGAEKVAGFAILPYNTPRHALSQEQFIVPSTGSLIFSLRNPNLVSDSERAVYVGGSALTIDEDNFSATPSTGTVKVDIVGGRIKFAAGDAGSVVNFLYRYNLTVEQAQLRFQERNINNRDLVGLLNQVGVAKGYVEIETDQYDSTQDYTSGSLKVGANGQLTVAGSGSAIPQGRVLAVPGLSDSAQGAFLRVSALIG